MPLERPTEMSERRRRGDLSEQCAQRHRADDRGGQRPASSVAHAGRVAGVGGPRDFCFHPVAARAAARNSKAHPSESPRIHGGK